MRKEKKICLLGDSYVGKTSIFLFHKEKIFKPFTSFTRGFNINIQKVKFPGDDKLYDYKIIDTPGLSRYKRISSFSIYIADGFLLVFSIDKIRSLEQINHWIEIINEEEIDLKEKVVILVGNKIDTNKRAIKKEEIEEFAKKMGIKYRETSAKTGEGIDKVFLEMYNDIYEKFYDNNENIKVNYHLSEIKILPPKVENNLLPKPTLKLKERHLTQFYTLNKFINY